MEKIFSYITYFLPKSNTDIVKRKGTFVLILLAIFLTTFTANATIYYVSSTSGNDSDSGTSESQPWRSIAKVNKLIPKPGDQILFKRGDSWTGTLAVNASGTSGSQITYGAYGVGTNPVFYGSDVVSGWVKHSGNIYKASFSSSITQIFIDDNKAKLARYPNTDYFDINSVSNTTTFTSNQLNPAINYKGATWIGRTVRFRLISKTVTSSSSTTLTLDSEPLYGLNVGRRFILTNKLEFLDSPGEWYYDSATKTIYLWTFNGDSPANHLVRGSTNEYFINTNDNDYITIKDLNIKQFSNTAINTDYSDNVTIENNNISDAGASAIYAEHASKFNVLNNTIQGTGNEAIFLRAPNSLVEDNKISDVCLFDELGIMGAGIGAGIIINADDVKLRYNQIQNIGYSGIIFKGQRTLIEYNFIDNICLTLIDGGGIYTYTGSDITVPGAAGSIIRNNIITNGIGSGESFGSVINGCNALYMDHGTHDVLIEGNVLATNSIGLMLHECSNVTVKNNTIFDALMLLLHIDQHNPNTITNNIFCTADRNGTTSWWTDGPQRLIYQKNGATGIYNYNTYVSHYMEKNAFQTYLNFAAWKTATKQDANSSCDVTALNTGETEKLFYNNSKQSKTFNLGSLVLKDIYGNTVSKSFTLQPFTSRILIGTSFAGITEDNPNPDSTAPTVTSFIIPSNSSTLSVPVSSFIANDNIAVTGYKLTESALAPAAGDMGWSTIAPTSYTFTTTGYKTLYAWAKDASGNVSSGVSSQVNIVLESNTGSGTLGNTDIFSFTANDNNLRAIPVTFAENATVNSISIYHNGGTGSVMLGVYADQSGSPAARLGVTQATLVNSAEGWQTITLANPVDVTSGQTVWLAWIFQSNPGVRYAIGAPGRASASTTWSSGIPADFGTSNIADYKYSIYCSYSTAGTTTSTGDLGNLEIFSYTANDNNLRAMPVTFTENATVNSISIYHNGGTGSVMLGVYADQSGSPAARLGLTQATLVNSVEGWQTITLANPVDVSSGQTIWLAWVFQSNPGVRYTTGSPGRASASTTWSSGIPADFGTSNIADYKYSIYCSYSTAGTTTSTGDLGNMDIFTYTANDNNLRAMPVTFAENATVNSISIYHNGGTGSMMLGVYADQSGSPAARLGLTQATLVNSAEGWQTITLANPVDVSSGQTIWLAWVFQSNPGVRYTIGAPGRASASTTWSSGIPTDFGSSNIANYKYSIYCSYSTTGTTISTGDLGNMDIFTYTANDNNLRAMPVTFAENATVNSISIYHNGGTGSVMLGVYADQSGSPAARLGLTQATLVNSTEGWQTITLANPVDVSSGQTVWLAWVFQSNPGVRYSIGAPGRASASTTWSSGIPTDFGSSNIASYKYSIYCTYTSSVTVLKDAVVNIEGISSQPQAFAGDNNNNENSLAEIANEMDFTLYPNPSSTYVNIDFNYLPETEIRLIVIDYSGRTVVDNFINSSTNRINVSQFPAGLYLVKAINDGKIKIKKLVINR